MKKKTILTAMLLCLALCTACGNVPEPDSEELAPIPTAAPETEAVTEAATEAAAEAPTLPPAAAETGETDGTSAEETETEPETELKTEPAAPWTGAYQALLSAKCKASEDEASYFALIRLDADEIPELVVLEGSRMELYCCKDDKTELLLEDNYKGDAVSEQNVCYQPEKSLFSTAFSTMGGGSGFSIYYYPALDPMQAVCYHFNNAEDSEGELPYNNIWDRAGEFEVTNGGYHAVTLGESWVHIGEDFDGLEELTEESAAHAGESWQTAEPEEE